jgi:hypothetical protein
MTDQKGPEDEALGLAAGLQQAARSLQGDPDAQLSQAFDLIRQQSAVLMMLASAIRDLKRP